MNTKDVREALREVNEEIVQYAEGTSKWRVLMNLRDDLENMLNDLVQAELRNKLMGRNEFIFRSYSGLVKKEA